MNEIFAELLDKGVPMTIHSDAPVTPTGPLTTAWAAVNRLTARGEVLGPLECISVEQALAAFPAAVLRVKGVVFVSERVAPLAVHRVGRRIALSELATAALPDRTSRLVAIGHRHGFDPTELTRLVEGARAG